MITDFFPENIFNLRAMFFSLFAVDVYQISRLIMLKDHWFVQ